MSSSTAAVSAISSLVLQFCPEFVEEQTATAAAPTQLPSQQQVLQVVAQVFNRTAKQTQLYLTSFQMREMEMAERLGQVMKKMRESFYQYDALLLQKLPQPTFKHYQMMQTREYNHPANTQAMILEGCRGLDPSKAVIVVCGAQFYTTQTGEMRFVEPLPEMLKYCAQLILVDQDEGTLALLKENLNSTKVVTICYDLSKGVMREYMEAAIKLEAEKVAPLEAAERVKQLCAAATEKMQALPLQILPPEKAVDFVVSSLVGCDIGYYVMRQMLISFNSALGCQEATEDYPPEYPDVLRSLDILCGNFGLLHARDIKGMAKRVYYADYTDRIVRKKDNPNLVVSSGVGTTAFEPQRVLWETLKTEGLVRTWYWPRSIIYNLEIKACLIVPNEKQDGKVDAPSKKK